MVQSLTHACKELISAEKRFHSGDESEGYVSRVSLGIFAEDVTDAAKRYVQGTHITVTYDDGLSRRHEVTWDANAQMFFDWGNNFWLHGPKSSLGKKAGGKWILTARHNHEVVVKAILDRAAIASKSLDGAWRAQRMWRYYWELLLMDKLRYSEEAIIDLHLAPLDVQSLAPVPTYNFDNGRELTRDFIRV